MNINTLKKVLPKVLSVDIPVMLVGHAGIGKTQIIKEMAEEHKRDLTILVLSQMEPGDLLGMPYKAPDGTTKYLKPEWWPSGKKNILFLDEINRAHPSVLNAILQLVMDKRIMNNVLPEDTWIVAAINPATEEYSVQEIFDKAFITRFLWLKVTTQVKDWEEYEMKNASPVKARFIQAVSSILNFETKKFDLPDLEPVPRSVSRLAALYEKLHDDKDFDDYFIELARGLVGNSAYVIYDQLKNFKISFTEQDLVKGRVDIAKSASTAERTKALENALKKNMIDEKNLDKVLKVLKEAYNNEELAVMVRLATEDNEIAVRINKLKAKSQELKKMYRDILTANGAVDITKIIDKMF